MNLEELRAAEAAGQPFELLCFYGHRPLSGGQLSAACFSQWWFAPFEVSGERFLTAEHYMMAGKARVFGDEESAQMVLAAASPAEAKQRGRQVKKFDDAVWKRERYGIVLAGNSAKFSQHPELRAFLLATGDKVLVEASPTDRIWGIGLASNDIRSQSPAKWRGQNLLGFALMEVRQRLRDL